MDKTCVNVKGYKVKPIIGLLLLLLVQSAAMAQISHSPSAFQQSEERAAAAKQKEEVENIYQHTHLNVRSPGTKKEETSRQKVIRTEKRKLRFNKKGKAVKRRHDYSLQNQ
ncbi:hypothetical protein FVR03_14755 [Pontibacter qinzhouensis]|uniref:Uncharacterized protein n=1 Tax=Pontibacter qinzhouensis TaxID=2603253 RepID=A0A5C8JHI6_9BACT|nr:hypothetical protein [Pontibacter qinzhouensis]TXK37790.1 hypothetical protein FVR03_14755 [Pontibacter qinzhouensis]